MTDITLTLPVDWQYKSFSKAGSLPATLRSACTYAAFGLSVAFSFAVVLGIVH